MPPEIKKPLSKRKPFRLLCLMAPEEIAGFRQYLEAAVFSGHPDRQLQQFFDRCAALNVWTREIDRDGFLVESGLDMSNNTFDKLVSRLYQNLISYAAMLGLMAAPSQMLPLAMGYLSKRDISAEEIDKKIAESRRLLDKTPRNARYFQASLDLHLVRANAAQSRTENPDTRRLHLLHDDLDALYYIQKLRFLCASINEQHVFRNPWTQEGQAELLQWLERSYERMPLLAQTYFHAFHVLRGAASPYHFEAFRRLLTEWEKAKGEDSEITDLYGYLFNYFSIRYNNGEEAVLPRIDQLFEDLLARGAILQQGRIAPEYFKNVINVKCRLGNPEGARKVFHTYGRRLTDAQDGAALTYNDVCIRFYERQFETVRKRIEALLEAPEGTKTDIYYGLDLRCLLLKTYFQLLARVDLEAWDEIDDRLHGLLRAFRGYIERKQIPQMARVRFENFRKAIHRLYTLYYAQEGAHVDERSREELLLDFRSSSNLPDKGWFIAQVAEDGRRHA